MRLTIGQFENSSPLTERLFHNNDEAWLKLILVCKYAMPKKKKIDLVVVRIMQIQS